MRRPPTVPIAALVAVLAPIALSAAETDAPPEGQWVERLNLGFETADHPQGWFAGGEGYVGIIDEDVKHSGARSLRLAFESQGQFGVATSTFPVAEARGRRLRYTGHLKTEKITTGVAGLWMRVDGPSGVLAFDNMQDRGLTGTTGWARYEIVLEVPEEATNINFGALLTGDGTVWVDGLDFELLPPAPPPAEVTVGGIVRDAEGRPVAGAHVALVRPHSPRATVRTRSDASGRFSVEVTEGEYGLTATTVGSAAAYVAPRTLGPEARVDIELGAEGPTVSGRVTDDAGAPLSGMAVQLGRLSEDTADAFYTVTDAEGRYAATLLPGFDYWITVESDTHVSAPRPASGADAAGDETVDLVAVRRGPAPPEVIDWIRGQSIPLETVEAGHGFADMRALQALVGDARVVALGEATHGSREFFQLKHRMLEFLVQEMGFTVFAIEANMPESRALDDYVVRGIGDPRDGLDGIYFWTWNTEEVLALVEWIRSYNADPAHERKVRFYGFDMQTPAVAVDRVLAYLKKVDPDRGATLGGLLEPLRKNTWAQDFRRKPREERDAVASGIAEQLGRLDARRKDDVASSSEEQWALARQDLVIAQQAVEMMATGMGGGVRDRAMAENVEWILAREPPGTKMVVWAHNGHVSRANRPGNQPMGWHLAKALGDAYLVCGFAFNRGSFQAIAWTRGQGQPGGLKEHTVGPAPEGNVGMAFARAEMNVLALDLRERPGRSVPPWFSVAHPMRQLGAIFSGEEAVSSPIILTDEYDALLFVERTTRAVPVERER